MSPSLQLANYPCALLKLPCKPHLSTNSWNFILLFLVTNVEATCVVDSWRWCLRALNTNMWSWQWNSCYIRPLLAVPPLTWILWRICCCCESVWAENLSQCCSCVKGNLEKLCTQFSRDPWNAYLLFLLPANTAHVFLRTQRTTVLNLLRLKRFRQY